MYEYSYFDYIVSHIHREKKLKKEKGNSDCFENTLPLTKTKHCQLQRLYRFCR